MTDSETKPAQPFIVFDPDGRPYIEGRRCSDCSAVMTSRSLACPACGSRAELETFRGAETGVLHAYSIVRRSFPGVATPFISAVVDLDDGLTLKGNLINVEPDPAAVKIGAKVRVVFDDALGRKDKDGASYVAYFFEPVV